ncbi:MAG: hypothetical protein AAGK02_05725 [Pseudomonadota bacterium]
MSALFPDQARAMRDTLDRSIQSAEAFAIRWKRLHADAAELADQAGLAAEPLEGELAHFPALLYGQADWSIDLAWQSVDDIDAMMQPGLTALRTIAARGQDVTAPALALWREFHTARNAVMALVEDEAEYRQDAA